MVDALIAAMGSVVGARWQNADQLHLTLAFLGDVDGRFLPDLDSALSAIRHPHVALSCHGVGHFTRRQRVTTLWASANPGEMLRRLASQIDVACRSAGIAPEGRPFIPHITIARLNEGPANVVAFLTKNSAFGVAAQEVRSFGLYQSTITPTGSDYSLLADYPLTV